jgi:hypothetical protein
MWLNCNSEGRLDRCAVVHLSKWIVGYPEVIDSATAVQFHDCVALGRGELTLL